jgi:hypothetical protein
MQKKQILMNLTQASSNFFALQPFQNIWNFPQPLISTNYNQSLVI